MTPGSDIKNWLLSNFADDVKFNEPMSRHTSFRVGGPADVFVNPKLREDAITIINQAKKINVPVLVIGGGTNLLVKDTGIRGIVMVLSDLSGTIEATPCELNKVIVKADAGIKTHALCKFAMDNGLKGMNFAIGIPGTIGGSISMNAGTGLGAMEGVVRSVDILSETGQLITVNKDELNFSYRNMSWADTNPTGSFKPIIFSGTFCLQKGNRESVKKEADELMKSRNINQPVSLPNAGCIFKNPAPENPAGKLIDLAGLKGKKIGDAQISEKHANFIVNTGNASASDIIELLELARKKVAGKFNIKLETEVQIVGS